MFPIKRRSFGMCYFIQVKSPNHVQAWGKGKEAPNSPQVAFRVSTDGPALVKHGNRHLYVSDCTAKCATQKSTSMERTPRDRQVTWLTWHQSKICSSEACILSNGPCETNTATETPNVIFWTAHETEFYLWSQKCTYTPPGVTFVFSGHTVCVQLTVCAPPLRGA